SSAWRWESPATPGGGCSACAISAMAPAIRRSGLHLTTLLFLVSWRGPALRPLVPIQGDNGSGRDPAATAAFAGRGGRRAGGIAELGLRCPVLHPCPIA